MAAQEVLPIELELKPQQSLVPSAPTPMDLLQMAVSQNFDVEKLEKLMQLQREWKADQARETYVRAMNAFKKNPPVITKNKHVHYDSSKGPVDYDHATLDHVCDQITKALSEQGISHDWKIDDATMPLKVTCILTHDLGHREETAMRGDPDETGSKNKLQARASTVSYLQRYTLLAAVGLAPANVDNDGAGGTNDGEVAEWVSYIQQGKTPEEVRGIYTDYYKQASERDDRKTMHILIDAKDARLKELRNAAR